jgi:isochorismate synthase
MPSGFAIAPFLSDEKEGVGYLEADILLTYQGGDVSVRLAPHVHHTGAFELLMASIAFSPSSEEAVNEDREATWQLSTDYAAESAQTSFINNVEVAVSAIQAGHFDKVVLSRTKTYCTPKNFEAPQAFRKLCEAYETAMVTMVYLPESNEIWLSASPEILVEVNAQQQFRTIALAGTQTAYAPDGTLIPKHQIRWGQKEIEEQALVCRYIIECFKKIRLREYVETGPKTVQAGHLYHLRSDFVVNMQAVERLALGSTMLSLLHPTSAVCGMPKAAALSFIQAVEPHDRSLYSGYWGPVMIEGQTQLYVNLRSMCIRAAQTTVYAGAGITEDSIAEDEWQETELKCLALVRVLGASSAFFG